jgi:hypothetical protein
MIVPSWIVADPARRLIFPLGVRLLGKLPRSSTKLQSALEALFVTQATRYAPNHLGLDETWCNLFVSDFLDLYCDEAIPHFFDPGDGKGKRYITANDMFDLLSRGHLSEFFEVGSVASASAVNALVAEGRCVVAVWKNEQPKKDSQGRALIVNGHVQLKPGHVAICARRAKDARESKFGIYVTGAGGKCVQGQPLEASFGAAAADVRFYAFKR